MDFNPVLYIVSTPIGNWEDITLRALNILKEIDVLICEEFRPASTLLKKLDLPKKEMISLNEHNEKEVANDIIQRIILGEKMALISDCGTPVFADPGHYLINQAAEFGIKVIPIPGASSLMATLSILDFKLEQFYFAGFLPREKQDRAKALLALKGYNVPIVLMDTPYRLEKLLTEVGKTFGPNRKATLAINITQENEQYLRGSLKDLQRQVQGRKAEFMLVVHAVDR
ncbi:MAG: 16S rRNA (cytidine(1402)-2'-O)-methyltransferase [Anaerolineaceae bacterium]|nr:16S rRNA (cytidine(1402)-2'-O)-methyltransferase [Anaerolineaceae bacterium]